MVTRDLRPLAASGVRVASCASRRAPCRRREHGRAACLRPEQRYSRTRA